MDLFVESVLRDTYASDLKYKLSYCYILWLFKMLIQTDCLLLKNCIDTHLETYMPNPYSLPPRILKPSVLSVRANFRLTRLSGTSTSRPRM